MAHPCQVCNGTGHGHVHAWEFRGYLRGEIAPDHYFPSKRGVAVRRCAGCRIQQVTHGEMHHENAIKGYEALTDVMWVHADSVEMKEAKRLWG